MSCGLIVYFDGTTYTQRNVERSGLFIGKVLPLGILLVPLQYTYLK